jgi:PAS domain S-box-containing protein
MKRQPGLRFPFYIVFIYFVVGAVWIITSDLLVTQFVPAQYYKLVSIAKGWLFIAVTAAILALLLRRYHKALVAQERRVREIIDNLPSPLYVFDPDGKALLINRALADLCGSGIENAVGKSREDLGIDAEAAAEHRSNDLVIFETGQTLIREEFIPQADGRHIYLTVKFPLTADDGSIEGVCGISTDITERKKIEEALRASEEKFRAIFEVASVGIVHADFQKEKILVNNEKYLEITGYTADELRSLRFSELTHPDDRQRDWEILSRAARGEAPYCNEKRYVRKDGSIVWVKLNVAFIRDDAGQPLYTVAICEDITDKKLIDEKLLNYQTGLEDVVKERTRELEETKLALINIVEDLNQKTEELAATNRELESFSYSVSHDLKAPLRGIDGYSRLLEEEYHDQIDAEGRCFLANIRQGTAQMHQLIGDLLAYSRMERSALQRVVIDLPALMRTVLAERELEMAQAGVQLSLDLPDLQVRADRDGLALVLRNLLENALKFSRDARPPEVEIGVRVEGDRAVLWVRDNGIGFDMKFHDRIFDMFQRLQRSEDYPGTGIGLALVRKAMQRMGGRVWADSAPHAGATFFLELSR